MFEPVILSNFFYLAIIVSRLSSGWKYAASLSDFLKEKRLFNSVTSAVNAFNVGVFRKI